jgi:hypothetical protein
MSKAAVSYQLSANQGMSGEWRVASEEIFSLFTLHSSLFTLFYVS